MNQNEARNYEPKRSEEPPQVGGSVLNVELDGLMYKPQKGDWKLIAPDGTVFVGESPLRCVKAEIDYRIPAHVQLQRLFDALDEDEEYDA